MSSFNIRAAMLSDAKGIAKVHVETWLCAYKGQIPDSYLQSLDVEKRTEKWQEILSNPKDNSHTIVAVENEKILGFCSVSHCRDEDMDPTVGELWAVYVDANNMGRGIGTALMNHGIEYLKEHGYKKATLWVLTSNEKTRKWYESKGWQVEGKTKSDNTRGFDIHETRYIIELANKSSIA